MLETGVVLSLAGIPLYWHMPTNRTASSLPDNATLWEMIWQYRQIVSGFAHSHPGRGLPGPSYEDVTSFAAIEAALGRRLEWPILSANAMVCCRFVGPHRFDYGRIVVAHEPAWTHELRLRSYHHLEEVFP